MPYTEQNHVGYQPVNTSLEAALHVENKAPYIRILILNFLRQTKKAWTSEEIALSLDIPYESTQPRLSELRGEGKVRDSGQRKPSRFNRRIICWEAV